MIRQTASRHSQLNGKGAEESGGLLATNLLERIGRIVRARVQGVGTARIAAAAIILTSCSSQGPGNKLTLTDGSKITQLLGIDDCSAVLVMSPRECMSCNGVLETWAGLGSALGFDLHLVLTSVPTAKQVEAFKLRRVALGGILSDTHAISESRAYLFAGPVAVDSIVGLGQQSLVLNQLAEVPKQDGIPPDQACPWSAIHSEDTLQ